MIHYLPANPVAGYSGFVVYYCGQDDRNICVWMIPGTFECDWDNR